MTLPDVQNKDFDTREVTIPNGNTDSGDAMLLNNSVGSIIVPANFTGTSLTFEVSYDGIVWGTLYWDDAAYAVAVAAVAEVKCISVEPAAFWTWQYIRVISNAAEGAERTLTLIIMVL